MKELIFTFSITFILIYSLYLIFVVFRKKKQNKIKKSTEIMFIKKRYKLNLNGISNKKIALDVAFCNALIISLTLALMTLINNFILQILVGFIILIVLILIVYSILGNEYRKEEKRNV